MTTDEKLIKPKLGLVLPADTREVGGQVAGEVVLHEVHHL